jgi:hypothetical protein
MLKSGSLIGRMSSCGAWPIKQGREGVLWRGGSAQADAYQFCPFLIGHNQTFMSRARSTFLQLIIIHVLLIVIIVLILVLILVLLLILILILILILVLPILLWSFLFIVPTQPFLQ